MSSLLNLNGNHVAVIYDESPHLVVYQKKREEVNRKMILYHLNMGLIPIFN